MNEPSVVTLSVDLMQLLGAVGGLVVGFLAIVFGFGRLLIRQFEKRLDERFDGRDQKLAAISRQIDKVEAHGQTLERDVLRLRAELPNEYVRREDWIRFSGTIDAKLDLLRDKCEATIRCVTQLMERMKTRGDDDGNRS